MWGGAARVVLGLLGWDGLRLELPVTLVLAPVGRVCLETGFQLGDSWASGDPCSRTPVPSPLGSGLCVAESLPQHRELQGSALGSWESWGWLYARCRVAKTCWPKDWRVVWV